VANFFLDPSIGIGETNAFQLKFYILHENYGRFLLPVTYFPTNLEYSFTPRVTVIKYVTNVVWVGTK